MRRRLPGLVLLIIASAYGFEASAIPVLGADAAEAMSARSLPLFLASALGIIGMVLLLWPADATLSIESTLSGNRGTRLRALALLGLCIVFSLLIEPLGVLLASAFLLAASLWVTGVRRMGVLIGVPAGVVLVLWFLLAWVLDIYLPTGDLWTSRMVSQVAGHV